MKTKRQLLRLIFSIVLTSFCATSINAQFLKKLGKRAENAAERAVERRVDKEATEKTDQVLDSILEPGSQDKQPTDKKGKTNPQNKTPNNSPNTPESSSGTGTGEGNQSSSQPKTLEVYSKYDFVPGDKLLFYDDFKNDFIGDFPSKWNTDGGGQIVTLSDSDQKWFEMQMSSYYIPDISKLPENYTIEFDIQPIGLDHKTSSGAQLHIILDESDAFGYGKNAVYAYLPFCQYIAAGMRIWGNKDGKETIDNVIPVDIRKTVLAQPHISIAVNKERFRLWVNEKKYLDVPRIVVPDKIASLKFEPVGFKDGKERLLITNIKVAEGGVDLRRKLISEGKISTNGILFDSGSANLQPQSMGIIRQIYQVMAQERNLKLKIVGHTDSDGDDSTNLSLSKQRADAVKNALTSVYNVAAERLTTEGKGALEPVGDNGSSDGKAQNRRVEFIKQN